MILLAGSARFVPPEPNPARPDDMPLEQRVAVEGRGVPTLLLKPGLEGFWHEPGANHVSAHVDRSWGRWSGGSGSFEVRVIPESRIVPWVGQPEAVEDAVVEFLGLEKASPADFSTGR